MVSVVVQAGPEAQENWKAALEGAQGNTLFEVPLYSDTYVVGEVTMGLGPYQLLNSLPLMRSGQFSNVMILRVASHLEWTIPDLSKTDTSRYHGGSISEELSAIAGLLLGIRLRAGKITRWYISSDSLGDPRAVAAVPSPLLPTSNDSASWRVPRVLQRQNVSSVLPRLASYPKLSAANAISLVRAARLYQDAMWFIEAQPELSWLLLVSAMEVVATQHQSATRDVAEQLSESYPDLREVLFKAGGEELVAECASKLARTMQATKRFVEFGLQFMPPAPPRPAKWIGAVVDWQKDKLRGILRKIYGHRSIALHEGIPFPAPMSESAGDSRIYSEVPTGLATGGTGGAWLVEDTPLLIHAFEYICRNSIINWWDSVSGLSSTA